jgi:cob(I)alamin adenosyltransferase
MKVYTKTGDKGTTALLAEPESKDHARIESYGTVDELNSHIGLIRDQEMNAHYKEILIEIQDRLYGWCHFSNTTRKRSQENGELRLKKLGIIESDIELLEMKSTAWKMPCHP